MNIMKRLCTLVGVGVLTIALAACGREYNRQNGIVFDSSDDSLFIDLGPDHTGEDFSEYRVGVSLSDCTSNTYCTSYVQALNEAMSEYGVDTTVFDAFGDPGQQAAQIKTLITMDVDMIILWPSNSDKAVSWVQTIQKAGIPVLMANTNVSPEGEAYVEGFVGPSGVSEGYATASRMLGDLEGTGNIVVMMGPENYAPVKERRKGLMDACATHDINIVEEYNGSSQRSIAKTYMEDCLKNHSIGEVDAVFCYDDEMALGVFDAMRSMNRLDEMRVYVAASGNSDILSYIQDGLVSASSIQSPVIDAKTTVNYALDILQGKPLQHFYNYISTPEVTTENVSNLKLSTWNS